MGSSEAARKAWVTRRKLLMARKILMAKKRPTSIKILPKPGSPPGPKQISAARKAWATRRKNEEIAEAERLEALRILDEMAKKRE